MFLPNRAGTAQSRHSGSNLLWGGLGSFAHRDAPNSDGPVRISDMTGYYPSIPDVRSVMPFVHASTLPAGPEWIYELNWTGERVVAAKEGKAVRLTSVVTRRDLTNRFPAVAATLARTKVNRMVIDAMIRAVDAPQLNWFAGHSDEPSEHGGIRLIALDWLWGDTGESRNLSMGIRHARLHESCAGTGILTSCSFEDAKLPSFAEARRAGANGIVAKRRDSRYRPYARQGDWTVVTLARNDGQLAAQARSRAERMVIEMALRRNAARNEAHRLLRRNSPSAAEPS